MLGLGNIYPKGGSKLTKTLKMGKKGADCSFFVPNHLMARFMSYGPYLAFAGTFHGGVFPVVTLMPPRKMGWNSTSTLYCFRSSRCFRR